MYCPLCGGNLEPNSWTWYCPRCQRVFEVIEHRYGKVHRYTAGEEEWNPIEDEEVSLN
jgi:Zn finger protein HypA/HybF involved in hydrogenase expression